MDELAPDHPGQRRLQGILHWADHLSDILKRLRNLARPPKEERDLVNLNQIVDNVLELNAKLLAQNEIQIRRALTPNLPPVWGSARMLEEVFMNLVINAKDAMPKGGTLDISTVVDDAKVLVHVQDTGVGMSPEVKEHVFEAFFTTKGEKGSGIGLNICRQIVVDHNGQISVESIEGQGSTFTVRLPLSNGANA
jgi:signal transduction histidine kinase